MITAEQERYVENHAYVPEHVLPYVTAISQTEPFLFGDFLVYSKKGFSIFVGYPLKEPFDGKRMKMGFEKVVRNLKPERVSLIAPSISPPLSDGVYSPSDHYYRLNLSSIPVSQKLRHMLNRARRELRVENSKFFDEDHRRMVEEFLNDHPVDEETRFIFRRIDTYLSTSKTARIFDARTSRGKLVAFDIAEFQPKDYVFYMFNFSSSIHSIPGASDLLLFEMIQQAKAEGKNYINLGLGINPGVRFFKEKWGGVAFLPYVSWLYHPAKKEVLETLLQKL